MDNDKKAYTLAQLAADAAALLAAGIPGDMPVIVEGCDCYGNGAGLVVNRNFMLATEDKCIVVKRED